MLRDPYFQHLGNHLKMSKFYKQKSDMAHQNSQYFFFHMKALFWWNMSEI